MCRSPTPPPSIDSETTPPPLSSACRFPYASWETPFASFVMPIFPWFAKFPRKLDITEIVVQSLVTGVSVTETYTTVVSASFKKSVVVSSSWILFFYSWSSPSSHKVSFSPVLRICASSRNVTGSSSTCPFFYVRSHLNEIKKITSIISIKFSFIFTLKHPMTQLSLWIFSWENFKKIM